MAQFGQFDVTVPAAERPRAAVLVGLVAQIGRGVGVEGLPRQAPLRQDLYVRSGWWRTGAGAGPTGADRESAPALGSRNSESKHRLQNA